MNHFSDSEDKGQYCQFVRTADGSYILEPVKVPAHIKAAREERIRKRDLRRRVMENRRRAQAIDARSLFFLSAAISVLVVIGCVLLYMQYRIDGRISTISGLQSQIEALAADNDILEKRLQIAENLDEVAEAASEKLGMSTAQPGQIWYYANDETMDYMLQFEEIE